ncbi:MAG: radical SAM protein [Desulfobacterales bacterium]|nr:radical SAM protein [Desulfobacterales bacterium]
MQKTVAFSKNAANVFFHILTKCNLACRHCYINPAQHGKQTLDLETIKAWLEPFATQGRKANVIFLGGEPTLHPDLAEAVRYARTLGYTSVTVDTNGYLFNHILDKVTPREVDYFSFSLDGATAATNDRLRGVGSWSRCVAGIKAAVDQGFATSLIYTVSRANAFELNQMPALLKQLGIHRFFIQVIGLRGRSATGELEDIAGENPQLTRDEWLAIVPRVAREVAAEGIVVTYPKVFLDPDEVFECAGRVADNYFVFPNGRVYRCPLCEDFPVHSLAFEKGRLVPASRLNEKDFFGLMIPEGCVMNRMIQPENIAYHPDDTPLTRVACCLLKEEIQPR